MLCLSSSDGANASGSTPLSAIKMTETEVKVLTIKSANLELAWALLQDAYSWTEGSNMHEVVEAKFGLASAEDITYLEAEDVAEIKGKLKLVSARKFASYFNF